VSDRKRLHLIRKAIEGVRQKEIAELLQLSERQVRRLVFKVQREGDIAIIHKLRGQQSNRRIGEEFRNRVLDFYVERYQGFGPTFAAEKLWEEQRIKVIPETLRSWLKQADISYPSRRGRPHRHWRKRKSHRGEMLQLDGSHHDWLEGRGPWLVLIAYIDDATSEVFGRFYEAEENLSVFDSFNRYVHKNGFPCSLYSDRHAVYKAERRPLDIVEQLEGYQQPLTNFQRALKELDIQLIHAYSPQAKGRVERLFRTLQDRLVKEMRLASISTKTEANKFLSRYLYRFNRKYRVSAENTTDLHRKLPAGIDLRKILCIRENRTLKNDFTVQYTGKFYQIKNKVRTKKISVERWIDSSLHFRCEGKELLYEEIHPPVRKEIIEGPGKNHHINRINRPNSNSPWRSFMINPAKP
ncbi:ISNCY family transposase, partial [bacterium]|nr:ISNCY family transposase [bacterium]